MSTKYANYFMQFNISVGVASTVVIAPVGRRDMSISYGEAPFTEPSTRRVAAGCKSICATGNTPLTAGSDAARRYKQSISPAKTQLHKRES